MIVHLRNAGFSNKGAELMLLSATRWLAEHYPDSRPAVHFTIGEPHQRRALGLADVVWQEHHRLPAARGVINLLTELNARRTPRPEPETTTRRKGGNDFWSRVAKRFDVVRHARSPFAVAGSRVDVVLDLSGFAYGDPWGTREAMIAASYYQEVRRRGGKVVLLPQQVGPFTRDDVRAAFRELSRHCDLIFAREEVSLQAAQEVVFDRSIVRQAPDFTIVQAGTPPADDRFSGRACIVPNFKMIEQRPESERRAYPDFLQRCVVALRHRGADPFVLLHEYSGRDEALGRAAGEAVGGLEIVRETDPLRLKGIIGASRVTIGSRFHGLVSALSQAVPSLATSWSHKYELLFAEYGCEECLVKPTLSDAELGAVLDHVLTEPSRATLIATLQERNRRQKARVNEMWQAIDELIRPLAMARKAS